MSQLKWEARWTIWQHCFHVRMIPLCFHDRWLTQVEMQRVGWQLLACHETCSISRLWEECQLRALYLLSCWRWWRGTARYHESSIAKERKSKAVVIDTGMLSKMLKWLSKSLCIRGKCSGYYLLLVLCAWITWQPTLWRRLGIESQVIEPHISTLKYKLATPSLDYVALSDLKHTL